MGLFSVDFLLGANFGIAIVLGSLAALLAALDPPVTPFLVELINFDGFTPSPTPSVSLQIGRDELFTVPLVETGYTFDASQLPSIYRVQIRNTGPTTDTFRITLPPAPPGYTLQSSVPEITIPPGQTAEVGLCLRPVDGIDAPGTAVPFSVTVASTTNPAVTASDTENFVTPSVHGVTLTPNPAFTSTSPGSSGPVELSITAAGNVAETVTLSASVPTGVTLSGLPSSVSLAQGETKKFPLTVNVGAGVALNQTLSLGITANVSGATPPLSQSTTIQLSLRSPAVATIDNATAKATDSGNASLTQALTAFSETLAQWQANPSDRQLCTRTQLRLQNLDAVLRANPPLAQFVTPLQMLSVKAGICDLTALLPLVQPLFTDLAAVAGQPTGQQLSLSLSPTSVELQPGVGKAFSLRLENPSNTPLSVSLALGILPAGVTVNLAQSQVTLAAREVQTLPITLSQTLASTAIFALEVNATASGTTQKASALVVVRPALADVVSVTATPNVLNKGQPVTASAQILNSANTTRAVLARVELLDNTGGVVLSPAEVPVNLVPSTEAVSVDLGQFSTATLIDGLYNLRVLLLTTDRQSLPGRSAQTPLFIGAPVSASISADPILVPPGTLTVKTNISVVNQTALGGGGGSPTGQFTPVLKWSWTAPTVMPASINVFMSPSVIDLDGDGLPEVVFGSTASTSGGSGGTPVAGVLRAVRGNTGAEFFTVTDPSLQINVDGGSLAVGDIDNDGKPEIIAGDSTGNRLIAFEHDGTFKWRSPNLERIGWGAPALADLDHDGTPEVVVGRQVLNSDGTIRWTGNGGRGAYLNLGPLSLVADVNLDGSPDVVAGNTVYSASGAILWQRSTLPDGFAAIGNFDSDPFPEIVLSSGQKVWLLEHDGTIKWGAVTLPGGGRANSGPPTVADYDSDGQPEIGVASANRYVVLETDGSLKWESVIQDGSSAVTGSSVFDFEGDGSAEVIYRDELKLRVYRGTDGVVLFETPMSSATWYEYPLVADVDGDNNAEIIVGANNSGGFGPQRGIFIFGSNDWVSTRKIWNQHSYHITNVNEDGTIPRVEQNNWQVPGLNNYRLNTFGPGDRSAADLSVEVRHKLPSTGYTVDPASISPAANVVSAAEVRWTGQRPFNNPAPLQFQISGQVSNMAPGETRQISLGTDVIATLTAANGTTIPVTVPLPPVTVAAVHIIDLDPTSQTVQEGAEATYTVILKNPLPTTQTFALGTTGLSGLTVNIATSVNVSAGQTVNVPLRVTVPADTAQSTRSFSVLVQLPSGGGDSVQGTLNITAGSTGGGGEPPPTVALDTLAVSVAVLPVQATAGQGTPVTFRVKVTNVGDDSDTYSLSGSFPAGMNGTFAALSVTVLPGLGNFREVELTVVPRVGTAIGNYPFTVTAASTKDGGVQGTAGGTVSVVGNGVDVSLSPPTAGPSSTFQLTVRNTGQSQDTFDLQLGGPAGVAATLGIQEVTLAAGQSQTIPIPVGTISFAFAGDLQLTAVATSRANTAVKDTDTASVRIGVIKGLSVTLTPTGVELSAPGPAPFLVEVNNLGNTEDAYKAEIVGSTGPITATLSGLNRQATQAIDLFRLPGLGNGGMLLNTTLTATGEGKVTVRVTSLSDPVLTADVIATVRTPGGGSTNRVPVADAGDDKNVAVGKTAQLDGSDSFDPDGDQITYTWTVVSVPQGSQVKTETLEGKTTPKPTFTPDVAGPYVFRLVVNDGKADSVLDEVTITAVKDNVPPNADAGDDLEVQAGAPVTADGSTSADPDNGPQALTYQWTVLQIPSGSTIQNSSLTGADQAKASFTPDKPGIYGLRLTVSDGAASDTDEVLITVRAQNVPPTANAGPDQTVTLGKEVKLSGQDSTDSDNGPQPLTYSWRFVSKPPTSKLTDADLIGSETVTPKFQPDVTGSYVIELEVFDGAASGFDNVVIEIIAAVAQDVTSIVRITTANEKSTLDRVTRKVTSTADLTIANTSDKVIKVPIRVVFLPTSPEVTMPEASGLTTEGKPFYDLGAKKGTVELKPNEAVTFPIKFVYASTVRFTYTVQVFGVTP